jgi:FixJ family two-component response regulator
MISAVWGNTYVWVCSFAAMGRMCRFLRIGPLATPLVSIVDDDEAVRVATTKLVRLHGFIAHAFASAEEFLRSPRVDETCCLITDVRMPGMSGVDLQSHLIREGKRLPIIFITAMPDEVSRARALEAGAVAFLTKPFDGQMLINVLRDALNGALDGPAEQRGGTKD